MDNEYGKEYWRNIKWAFIYSVGVLIGIGFSLDYFEPAPMTMEQLNDNPAWHNWVAGGLFAIIVAAFAYSVYKAFKK
jgi:Na+/H+ antiporter NhaA